VVGCLCRSHVAVWVGCWGMQLQLPRSASVAREAYLEAMWWLLHRLSAFNVMQERSLMTRLQNALGADPPPLPDTVRPDEAVCALWLVLLPSVAHSRALPSRAVAQRRLEYAISRCQRALLQASPPVLEELIVWLPQALQQLLPAVDCAALAEADTRRLGSYSNATTSASAVGSQQPTMLVLRSLVPDDRPCASLLGIVWQTVVFSLTHDLEMPAFPGWSQIGLSAGTHSQLGGGTPSSTADLEGLCLRSALAAPFALLRVGQAGLAAWMDAFPYCADSLIQSPHISWQRLCKMWLPYEVLLAGEVAAGRGAAVSASYNAHISMCCGGVYPAGEKRASVTSTNELRTSFQMVDNIAQVLHENGCKELPLPLSRYWSRWLRANVAGLLVGWHVACMDILSDLVPVHDLAALAVADSRVPALTNVLDLLLQPRWKGVLLEDRQEDVVVLAPVPENPSSISLSANTPPRPARTAASVLTLSASPSSNAGATHTAATPIMQDLHRGAAIVVIAEVFSTCVLSALQRVSETLAGVTPPQIYVPIRDLLLYVAALLRTAVQFAALSRMLVDCAHATRVKTALSSQTQKFSIALKSASWTSLRASSFYPHEEQGLVLLGLLSELSDALYSDEAELGLEEQQSRKRARDASVTDDGEWGTAAAPVLKAGMLAAPVRAPAPAASPVSEPLPLTELEPERGQLPAEDAAAEDAAAEDPAVGGRGEHVEQEAEKWSQGTLVDDGD